MYGNMLEMRSPFPPRCTLTTGAAALQIPLENHGSRKVGQRHRLLQGTHAPFAAATQAVYETLKALREGLPSKNLKGLASSELTGRVTREVDVKARLDEFLGLKR